MVLSLSKPLRRRAGSRNYRSFAHGSASELKIDSERSLRALFEKQQLLSRLCRPMIGGS